ncbi:MAG TPA: bifunctional UDP-N-acetylglucosamine diphosphorylase/glucosamine-1-phosphate N-acetyltransferase GlmU [Candidatus Baltobacteraceae bacterium]|nr:bifunctional UDP-N-acetylglucosamine diphosphorylase/glucosamine-1-phosphate N-acetyltransferase GlmU [Candidatus Baltobacteraceae bacterium]
MSVRAIVLAAGKGTRMKSRMPKVLHELCGRPMLWYTLRALHVAGIDDVIVVTSGELQEEIARFGVPGVVQSEQLGTGHAVKIALENIGERADGKIVVAYGDMPLVPAEIFGRIVGALDDGKATVMSLVTVKMPLPSNFGRVVRRGKNVKRIVEVRDASADELEIEEMNAGVYAFGERELREAVAALENDNAQKEYYLTDVVEHFVRSGKRVRPILVEDHVHALGINDRVELAIARREMNARICAQHMRDGVTILDPATTYLEPELEIGRDTVIYPNTAISLLTTIGENCTIGPNARLSEARIGDRVEIRESVVVRSEIGSDSLIGPFAHIRGRAKLAGHNRVGNFVEIKNSEYARGAKSAHLAYLGDSSIGEETNIGAGTITCNFDGQRKNRTTIGKNVSIGSNTSIVAPRTIGDGALTGAGSVVTKDVAPGERVAGNPAKPLPQKEAEPSKG